MKPWTALLLLFILPAAPVWAQTFHLKNDATGTRYGPFEFKPDAKIVIDANSYTIVKSNAPPVEAKVVFEPTTDQKLDRTIIPIVDFNKADIRDAIEFIRQASEEFSPFPTARHKGLNMVLQLDNATPENLPIITFKAQQISVRQVLNAVTSIADLEVEMRDNWMLIKPRPKKKK